MKMMNLKTPKAVLFLVLTLLTSLPSWANVAGGGTGTGANVTVSQSGSNVVLSNGIVSFTIDTANANITNFTYDGTNLLAGGSGGGHFYIDGSGGPGFSNPTYTLTVNPANNGGNQAEVWLQQTGSPMDAAVYFDLLRGQQGFYDTLILTHQTSYPDYPGAELRTNVYVGSIFDFLCVDPYRFRQMGSPNDSSIAVPGAPKEVTQWTSGIYNGLTECKYGYSDPLGDLNVWGWASSSKPYGIWQTVPSHEYYDGGPMHRELTEHIGNTLLNMFGGGHYGFGSSGDQPAGTFSSKTFGPAFVYANKYTGSSSDPVSLKARSLWADAQAQSTAEQNAWPYTWFKPQPVAGLSGSAFPQGSGRGTVTGTFAINDTFNPSASPVSMWIGLAPVDSGIDFQQQYLTSQFWVKTGSGGSFTIPNVLPGTYNLWAFGPGAAGTFEKTNVTVTGGQPLNLGAVTWTPLRQGATVWEIGIPDRNSNEFNNGEHSLTPYSGVLPGYAGGAPFNTPSAWGAFMGYGSQYPNGVSYTVGSSNFATNWSYCQPTLLNSSGSYVATTSKIFFNLASAPSASQTARLYLAFAAVNSSACILTVNGVVQTGSVVGSTDGSYSSISNSSNGFVPPNHSFDSILRLGSEGAWGDAYLNFSGSSLKAGQNEIDISMRPTGGAGLGQGFEYDYVRLELSGFNSGAPTPTKTNTPVPPTATKTNTPVATSTFTATRTNTATFTFTSTPTATFTATRTNTATNTPTKSNTPTFTFTSTPTATFTVTRTNTPTNIPSSTATPTITNTPAAPTSTFTSTPTATLTPVSGQVVIQAENNCGFSGTIDSNHLGFTGTGFANLTNNNTAGVTFALNSTIAQNLSITFRYSDGTTTARPMLLSRTSPSVSTPVTVNFGVTTTWDTWATITVTVPLVTGANLISLVPTGTNTNGGPNLDELTFTSSTVTAGSCGGSASAMLLSGAPSVSQGTAARVVAAPNVSRNGSPIQFQITLGQPGAIQLSLFAVTGEKVYQTVIQGNTGKNNFDWLLEDQAGSSVASGLYVYSVQIQDGSATDQFTGKVVVVH